MYVVYSFRTRLQEIVKVEFVHHAPAGNQLSCLEWLRVLDNSSPLPDVVQVAFISAPVVPIGEIGRACMCTTRWQAASRALFKFKKRKCRQDELGIVGIFLWYRIGSAPCPSLPSIHH
jgi:hypothetical protein